MNTVEYKNYGKCAVFVRGGTKVMVTLDVGPRIVWFGTEDFNFLNEDLDRNVNKGGDYFDENYGKGTTWYLYGGHRVWKSPEDLETYTPDNFPVECKEREWGGSFTCRAGLRIDHTLDIELAEDGSLTVLNTLTNKGEARELSVWGLTVAAKGGTLVLPLNDPVDDLNPVYNVVRWPYNDPEDERLCVGEKFLTLRQTDRPEAIKIVRKKRRGVLRHRGQSDEMGVRAGGRRLRRLLVQLRKLHQRAHPRSGMAFAESDAGQGRKFHYARKVERCGA